MAAQIHRVHRMARGGQMVGHLVPQPGAGGHAMDQEKGERRRSRPVPEMQFHIVGYGHGKIHAGILAGLPNPIRPLGM
ncbi:hypothetical protein GCM10017744_013760 [Streptomyces antimycoticus]